MTTFVEMALLWVVRLLIVALILFGFFQTDFEFGVAFDPLANVVYDFGAAVPQLVLRHTSLEWRVGHNCFVGYECKGVASWERYR